MKKVLYILLICLIGVISACSSNESSSENNGNSTESQATKDQENAGATEEMEPVTWVYGNYLPSTHSLTKGFEKWAQLVEEKTEGKVMIDVISGAALGGAAEVVSDVKGGTYDIGYPGVSFAYEELFKSNIGNLPFAFPNNVVGSKVMQKFVAEHAMDEYEDVKLISMNVLPPYWFASTKPIESLDDLEGLKIRVYGRGGADLIESWGATPVSISSEEIYTALDRGTIDAVIYNPLGIVDTKFGEVAPYITKVDTVVFTGATILNKDAWNKLSDDMKTLFEEELFPAYYDIFNQVYVDELDSKVQYMKENLNFTTMSPENVKELQKTAIPVWEAWVEEANQRGLDGEALMSSFLDLLEEEGVKIDFVDY